MDKFLNWINKYTSRKFVATVVFGGVIAVVFHSIGLSETVILGAMGLAGIYAGANAISKKVGSE